MAPNRVGVWDRFVRCCHWSPVWLFTAAYLIGEENLLIHTWSDYAVLALIGGRVVWGSVGPQRARFGSFLRGPIGVGFTLRGYLPEQRRAISATTRPRAG